MLAVIEHDQELLVPDLVAERRQKWLARQFARSEHLGDRARHPHRIDDRGQIDEPDTVAIGIDHFGGQLLCQPGLADAAGADQRQ